MNDRFHCGGDSLVAPARYAFAVTPDDDEGLPFVTKALCIGTAGTLVVRAVDSNTDVTLTVVAGQIVPLRCTHVRETGSTATGIVGLS